jgi:hypothetical protein
LPTGRIRALYRAERRCAAILTAGSRSLDEHASLLLAQSRSVTDSTWSTALDRLRFLLFLATGLAVPLYAFPPFALFGRPVDLATVLAAAFVLASLPAAAGSHWTRWEILWSAAAALVPLLALVPPRPDRFGAAAFSISFAHWVLLVAFFLSAARLEMSDRQTRWFAGLCVGFGCVLALFGLYQVVGSPRHWPLAGEFLLPFQRSRLRLARVGDFVRPTSLFLEPSMLGGFLVFLFGVGLAERWGRRERERRAGAVASAAGLALILIAIAATISWGAFADLGALLLGLVFAARRSGTLRPRQAGVVLAGAVVVLVLFGISPPGRRAARAVLERAELLLKTPLSTSAPVRSAPAGRGNSLWVRYYGARHTISLARRYPVGGIGLGQYRRYVAGTLLGGGARHVRIDAWCGWLAAAAEMGWLGPGLIVGALALVGFSARRSGRTGRRIAVVSGLLLLAAVEQLHTASYVDLWWWYPLSVAAALGSGPSRVAPASGLEPIDR